MLMRSELRDSRLGPFENKFTNPQFARALAGTTIARKNWHPNPTPVLSNYAYTGGAGAIRRVTDPTYGAAGEIEASGTGAMAANGNGSPSYIPVRPGEVWAVSAEVWTTDSTAVGRNARIRATWLDSSQSVGSLGTAIVGIEFPLSLTVQRVGGTITIPPGVAYLRPDIFVANNGATAVGQTFRWRSLLVERVPALLPAFDGATANTLGVAYSWEGVAYQSPSLARVTLAEVRRNLAINPDANPNTNLWQTQVPTGYAIRTTYEVPTDLAAIYTAVLNVDTSDGSLAQFRIRVGGSAVNISPLLNGATSVPVSISFDFWASSLLAGKVHALEIPVTGSPGGASTFRNSYSFTPAAGWNRIEIQATLTPQQTVTAIDYFQHPQIVTPYIAVPAGTVLFKAARALIEMTPAKLGGYFSGAFTPDADLTPSWLGTADNSGSTLSAVRVDGTSGNAQTQIAWIWNSNAARSFPTTASQDTAVRFSGEFNGFQFGMLPGRTYTLMARVRVLAAQVNPGSQARRIVTYWYNGASHITVVGMQQAPNAPGVYDIRAVWTVPINASQSFVRLYDSGAAVDTGKIQFERFQIVEGKYDGGFFDGDTKDCIWRGQAHGSPSVGYPPLALAA